MNYLKNEVMMFEQLFLAPRNRDFFDLAQRQRVLADGDGHLRRHVALIAGRDADRQLFDHHVLLDAKSLTNAEAAATCVYVHVGTRYMYTILITLLSTQGIAKRTQHTNA